MKAVGDIEKHGGFSAEVQVAIKAELDLMLAAPVFAQSGRCKRFLTYVVLETLSGNAGQLKERTIGISVFDRPTDYDTGDDSIVRVTANEVRKRIGQFYAESHLAHAIQIELPRGSYVPEFTFHPGSVAARQERSHHAAHTPPTNGGTSSKQEGHATEEAHHHIVQEAIPHETTSPDETSHPTQGRITTQGSRAWLRMPLVIVLLVSGAVAALWGGWKTKSRTDAPDVWAAFEHASGPILLCLGAHDPQLPASASASDSQKFSNYVLGKQMIPLDDAAVISSIASLLGKKGIPFRVVGADQASLADLRRQPVIFVGALDNKWTLRLTQGLRYRFDQTQPTREGSDPIASIISTQQPAEERWTVDFSEPMNEWENDYAIVARIDDTSTGLTALIEAGLGNNGSLAATEFITSGAFAARVASEPSCVNKPNAEAVVQTEMIDDKAGPPHAIRFVCW